MQSTIDRKAVRQRIRYRIRKKISGSAGRPRVAVFRSEKHIYAQAIDDEQGKTLAAVTTTSKAFADQAKGKTKTEQAKILGGELAAKAKDAGVETVCFDRGHARFHGRVKAFADGAREGGLKF